MKLDPKKILIKGPQLEKKVKFLADRISNDYKTKNPVLVGILKGSFIFLSDLVRYLKIPHEVDFIAVASYGASTYGSGVVRWLKDLSINIESRNVIIVEDIVDTGLTLKYIIENLWTRNPRSVSVVTLLDKKENRRVRIPIKYVGFTIPSYFVVGYGLDYNEQFRNLPYVIRIDNLVTL